MTLIVAIPADDAVVFGSDTQVTVGEVRSHCRKVFDLNNNALWAASGELALIQRVAEQIESLPNRDQPLATIRDALAQIVKNTVHGLLNLDFRTQFMTQSPEWLLQLHQGDFLFVEFRDKPRILHILINGTPEWVEDRIAATGSGGLFAHALLQKYAGRKLTRDQAKLLTYKVIEEAIEVGAYGLGPPIDICDVSATGKSRASEEELSALDDAARLLREWELNALTNYRK